MLFNGRGGGDVAERRGSRNLRAFLFARTVENLRADFNADNADQRGKHGCNERREKEVGGVCRARRCAHADYRCGQDLQTCGGDDRKHYHIRRGFGIAVVHAVDCRYRHGRCGVAQPEQVCRNVHCYVLSRFDVARREKSGYDGAEQPFQTARQPEPLDKREEPEPERVQRQKIERKLHRAVRAVDHGIDRGGWICKQHQPERRRKHDKPNNRHAILYERIVF